MIGVKVDKNNSSKKAVQKKPNPTNKSLSSAPVSQLCGDDKKDDKTAKDGNTAFAERNSFWSPDTIQGKFYGDTKQLKSSPSFPTIQLKNNKTGLPDDVKAGTESLSGVSLNDVKVHYNSSEPAQLHAHAFAQGTDIHVAPGQEKHVPHEAWHVVQQKQGRVQATTQMKGMVPVNDDAGLEKEADVMGAKAVQMASIETEEPIQQKAISNNGVAQLNPFSFGKKEKPERSVEDLIRFHENPMTSSGNNKSKSQTPISNPAAIAAADPQLQPSIEPAIIAAADPQLQPSIESAMIAAAEPQLQPSIEPAMIAAAEPQLQPSIEPAMIAAPETEKVDFSLSDRLLMTGGSIATNMIKNIKPIFLDNAQSEGKDQKKSWLNTIMNPFFGEKNKDTNQREGGFLDSITSSFFGKKNEKTNEREGGFLDGITSSFFGKKNEKTNEREGGFLDGITSSFFGKKNEKTKEREGGFLDSITSSFFGKKNETTNKTEGGLVNNIWEGTTSSANDKTKWGDEYLKNSDWGSAKGIGNKFMGGASKALGYLGAGATLLGGGLLAGGTALVGGLAAGGTALGGGLAAGGTALGGGLAAGGTALAGGLAAGGTALAGGLATGGTALAGGIATAGLGVGAGLIGGGALLGKAALHYGSMGASGVKGIFSPDKYEGATHAKYGDDWGTIDDKHVDQMKRNKDHQFSKDALPKGYHADGRENYGETENYQKGGYVSTGIGGILNFSNMISKKAGVADETLRNVGMSAGSFGAVGALTNAVTDASRGFDKGTSTSTKVKAGADVTLDIADGVSSFSSLMTTAEHAANMSGMFSIITGSLEIVRGAIGVKNAYDRKESSNNVLIKVLTSMCTINNDNKVKPDYDEAKIKTLVYSKKESDKEIISQILRSYQGEKADEYHELANISDDVSKIQDRNKNTAFGQIAKGALAVAGGAVLLALGGAVAASPVGWVLLGAAAVAGIGMLIYNQIQKGKSKKEIAIRELNVDRFKQNEWDEKHESTNSIWNKFSDADKTREELEKQGTSPLDKELRKHEFSNIDHFYSNYINATSHKIVYEAYVIGNVEYDGIVEGLGFKTKVNIDKDKIPKPDDPLQYYPTPKQIATQLNN